MSTYNPPRKKHQELGEPLEVELVYHVRSCGTCSFFWPKAPEKQPYGPFPSYDFKKNFPKENKAADAAVKNYPWVEAVTSEPCFPNGEVMDGCRKAPIMTIGINPNLTAFAPGQQGTSWIYPSFTDRGNTDPFAKYAYYYRYRSVYQEHLNLSFMKEHILKEGQIIAEKDGVVLEASRINELPQYNISVQYDNDDCPTKIGLTRKLGDPRYVVFFDHFEPNNRFKKGDVIAAKLNVPSGINVEVEHGAIGYYEQFVPVLSYFESFLKAKGFKNPQLKVGEDVGQLDMVACASPHWNESFMGGELENVVRNCVKNNSWAIKQLVQTKPAVLFLVGESSFNMFNEYFYKLIKRESPLSAHPVDGAFTLFKETVSLTTPTYIEFKTTVGKEVYSLKTRLVIAPHFSYNSNYVAQYRLSIDDWEKLKNSYSEAYDFFHQKASADGIKIIYAKEKNGFIAVQLTQNPDTVRAQMKSQMKEAFLFLESFYYNPHLQMADLLGSLYDNGVLSYEHEQSNARGQLRRTEGACHFCVNDKWEFPLGCPYGKTKEKAPSKNFLATVAQKMVVAGSSK